MADAPYVIWSVEHRAWWRPGRWGYTPFLSDAGHYTREEAEQIIADANIVTYNEEFLTLTDALAEERQQGPRAR